MKNVERKSAKVNVHVDDSAKKSAAVKCNYKNNYYGDQVCKLVK